MEIKIFDSLPQEAKNIRRAVFIEEQKFTAEFDGIDERARHLVVFVKDDPVATCRIYPQNKDGKTVHIIGRIAVLKEYRGKNIGSLVLKEAESDIINSGGKVALLHSQCAAKDFYAKNGYTQVSKIDYDEDCPHIWMSKQLSK